MEFIMGMHGGGNPTRRQASKAAVRVLCATCLTASTVLAGTSQVQRPHFSTDVELVQLQVGVANVRGAFVGGLGAEDFVIVVDGDPRPAMVVYEVDVRPGDVPGASAIPTSGRVPSRPAAARRHFLLFFDFAFNSRRGIREARRAALEFMERNLDPSDLVAVATVDRFGIEFLVPFTRDHGSVRQSLRDLSLAQATDLVVPTNGRFDYPEYVATVASYMAQLRQLGEMLQAIGGRKHIVMFSTGFLDAGQMP